MKITYAPLVDSGSGKFGGVVFSSWKGIDIARRFVRPSNPRTSPQVVTRNVFANANSFWQAMAQNAAMRLSRGTWTNAASGRAVIGRNLFVKEMVGNARADADPTPFAMNYSPLLPPATALDISGTAGAFTISLTVPTAYVVDGVDFAPADGYCIIWPHRDVTAAVVASHSWGPTWQTAEVAAGAVSFSFAGLTSGDDYDIHAFATYEGTVDGETVTLIAPDSRGAAAVPA